MLMVTYKNKHKSALSVTKGVDDVQPPDTFLLRQRRKMEIASEHYFEEIKKGNTIF